MTPNIQPILENDRVILLPLQETDFEQVFNAAADPKIWEQHPNRNRWQKNEFEKFFQGAIQSQGSFKILDKRTGDVIGSTRFYDHDQENDRIQIGYTFYTTQYWGTGINRAVKALMLDYIFQFVSAVHFHIGAENVRSQIAITRLGATKVGEQMVAYFGEAEKSNFVYEITKQAWLQNSHTWKS